MSGSFLRLREVPHEVSHRVSDLQDEVIIPVTDGRLDFGPWQQVYYAEFDGQRGKRVICGRPHAQAYFRLGPRQGPVLGSSGGR